MDNKLIIALFASVILSGVRTVEVKTNHASITINQDEPYDLVCSAPSVDIKGCLFTTPTGQTYILWAGASYEGGRVTQKGDGSKQCAVSVSKAQDTDNGKWTCQISTMDSQNNAASNSADVEVTVAVPPTKVQINIEEVNEPSEYSVKMGPKDDPTEVAVDCVAVAARPPPQFQWFLGEDPLKADITPRSEEKEGGKKDYIETLKYYPNQDHDGKTLRCQVTHQAYTQVQKEGKVNEAEVVLKVKYAPLPTKTATKHYDLHLGQKNDIRMQFSANPKPTEGFWVINKTKVPIAGADENGKYSSGSIEEKDGLPGQWEVTLTINKLSKEDVESKNSLTITNAEGETSYEFQLQTGKQPPPAKDTNSLTVGIIVIIVIILVILVVVIVARAKGMLCFAAAKGGDDLDEEKEAFENVEKGESNAIVQDSKPLDTKGTPEKKLDQDADAKAEKEEKKSNGAHTPV